MVTNIELEINDKNYSFQAVGLVLWMVYDVFLKQGYLTIMVVIQDINRYIILLILAC